MLLYWLLADSIWSLMSRKVFTAGLTSFAVVPGHLYSVISTSVSPSNMLTKLYRNQWPSAIFPPVGVAVGGASYAHLIKIPSHLKREYI